MAADLGMKDLAATACKDGTISLWLGGELAALERYFEMQKAKTTKSTSRKSRALKQKRSGQRSPLLNSFTKSLVRDAEARGVTTIIVGILRTSEKAKTGEPGGTNSSINGRSTGSSRCLRTRPGSKASAL